MKRCFKCEYLLFLPPKQNFTARKFFCRTAHEQQGGHLEKRGWGGGGEKLGSTASNSGYTQRGESEFGTVACQKSKSEDRVLHRCGPVTEPWSPGEFYKSSPLRKFYVILTFQNGDKRGRCKYCNLAFMNCSLETLACFCLFARFCRFSF